ncbi:ATP-binding cassette domain-containing protein [Paenibacillus nanensis]|uniref:ATP-binding cassette domain-containing protein n=1 Tax=Paenibacillus nanensis TaxID=393251 RepID=A0A3A1UM78_9BACL|nr:ATP-binding cassette domain-containing protein [Paenibacillus nanensis]
MSLLQLSQLTKTKQNVVLLPAIDLSINGGQCVAIQTNYEQGLLLIRLILGMIPASGGSILFHGETLSRKEQVQKIAVYFQGDGVYERLKVRDYLLFWAKLYGVRPSIPDVLQLAGLADKADVTIAKMNDSERKRLHFARMIVQDPDLLVFETPEQNLDIESCMILRNMMVELAKRGKAILVTASSLESAISMTDEVYSLLHTGLKKIETKDPDEAALKDPIPNEPLSEAAVQDHLILEEELPPSFPEDSENAGGNEAAAAYEMPRPLKLEKIPAKIEDKIILFDPLEINYIESNEGLSQLHLNADVFPCAWTLNELEAKLKAYGFFRCHRSYIVNLQRVREVITWTRNSFSLVLDDPKKSSIPLSKNKYDALKDILGI